MSIIRMTSILTNSTAVTDATWTYSGPAIWGNVETNIAVICGCMPSLGPLFAVIWPSAFRLSQPSFKQPTPYPHPWTIGSEPRKRKMEPTKDSFMTDDVYMLGDESRVDTSDVPDGRIQVSNVYSVEAGQASKTRTPNTKVPWPDEN